MFWHNEEYSMGLGKDIYLDGVVCLVDAVYGRQVGASSLQPTRRKLTAFYSRLKKITLASRKARASGIAFRVRDTDRKFIAV